MYTPVIATHHTAEALPTAELLAPGQQVGCYRIVRQLARGGMGVVYEAVHQDIERRAAIKMLHAEVWQTPMAAVRFLNEARAVNRVRHPGLVEIFELGHLPDGAPYLVMELLEGELLSERLARVGRLPDAEVRRIGRRIAQALASVHDKGIVHRDLKPANIMLLADLEEPFALRVKVLDFGIAKMRVPAAGARLTEAGTTIGTPEYMAPEQCTGDAELGGEADVYALGVLLYEMLAGQPPFRAAKMFDVLVMQVREAPPLLEAVVPGVPADLAALVRRMLEKAPAARPPMSEVAFALAEQGPLDSGSRSASGSAAGLGTGEAAGSGTEAAAAGLVTGAVAGSGRGSAAGPAPGDGTGAGPGLAAAARGSAAALAQVAVPKTTVVPSVRAPGAAGHPRGARLAVGFVVACALLTAGAMLLRAGRRDAAPAAVPALPEGDAVTSARGLAAVPAAAPVPEEAPVPAEGNAATGGPDNPDLMPVSRTDAARKPGRARDARGRPDDRRHHVELLD